MLSKPHRKGSLASLLGCSSLRLWSLALSVACLLKSLPAPSTCSTGISGHLPALRTQGKPWLPLGEPLEFSEVKFSS